MSFGVSPVNFRFRATEDVECDRIRRIGRIGRITLRANMRYIRSSGIIKRVMCIYQNVPQSL